MNWTVDRWISVLGFAIVIISGIFVAGSRYSTIERDIAELKVTVNSNRLAASHDSDQVKQELQTLTRQVRALMVTPVTTRPSGAFPRTERFSGVDPE